MKRILFVNPSYRNDVLESVKVLALPPLNLGLLASLTPSQYEVSIQDEHLADLDFDAAVDLVAITAMSPLAPRAYAIAAAYRKRAVPVVLGGIHASMVADEAAQYVDCVVTGEAEEIWPKILEDFEHGRLQPIYKGGRTNIEHLAAPRRELFASGYFTETVQTSRGCPFDCNFCSVTRFNGQNYRYRDVEDVIAEIAQIADRRFFFADDNIVGTGNKSRHRAVTLFERLQELDKEWGSQICINIAEDQALLRQAAASGARFFFIGFESIDRETLTAMNKKVNLKIAVENFKETIKKIQGVGIAVVGGFMLGNDTDTGDVFDKTAEFVFETGIDVAQFTILTPLPGTVLYDQMARENRLIKKDYPADWRCYNGFDVVFEPRQMSVEELTEGHARIYRETASFGTSLGRAIRTLFRTRSLLGTGLSFYWNHDCYKAVSRRPK